MAATSERMVAMALLGSPILLLTDCSLIVLLSVDDGKVFLFWHTRVEEENQRLEQGTVTYGGSVITQEIQQGRTVLLLSMERCSTKK